jgi:hypothetical protein
MSTKTKSKKQTNFSVDRLNEVAQQAGVVLMTAAATIGMVELAGHPNKVALPNQPVLAVAGEHSTTYEGGHNDPIRREKEEAGPHHISYSTYQRTPSRTGKA